MEMLEQTGYVSGIENYSRQLSFRKAGLPPQTLLDYLPKDALIFIDESHMSMPQIRGMFEGDKARQRVLVDYGFRLPSALDNRPLKFNEFEEKIGQTVFVSATPADFEIKKSGGEIVEQLIRPTGLLEPKIEIRPASASAFAKASADKKATAGKPAKGQIKDAEEEIAKAAKNNERVLLVTLTKRLAKEIADYLREKNIKVEYLHSEIKTIERSKTLQNLRKGDFDVLVGINLLREGLDLPEVGLVAILDADKEGFLRNFTSLTQTIGRAARHPNGRAILYADTLTLSIERTIKETERRRKIQEEYNRIHKITPQAIKKEIRPPFWLEEKSQKDELAETLKQLQKEFRDPARVKAELERQMLEAASELRFEEAAKLRDLLKVV